MQLQFTSLELAKGLFIIDEVTLRLLDLVLCAFADIFVGSSTFQILGSLQDLAFGLNMPVYLLDLQVEPIALGLAEHRCEQGPSKEKKQRTMAVYTQKA